LGTTRDLAEWAVKTRFEDLPDNVVHEAKRDIINVLAVSIYSARDPSLRILLDYFEEEGGNGRAAIWGAGLKATMANAALANGYTAHLEDYDDTHFPTVIHPSAPTIPAAWATAEVKEANGKELLAAVAIGIEICCRYGNAVHPWHYDAGWHITGTAGVYGSSTAAGKLNDLDVDEMVAAMGIAGTQAAGVRETFGSMSKPLHAGRAAQAGVVASQLAKRGFTSTTQIIEGRRGTAVVMSSDRDLSRATEGLGQRWEIFQNGLKPYSCGVVSHPAIDAAIAFKARGVDPDAIESIEALVHPLVPELMGRPEPQVGLEGKFSVQHTIACGLVDGAAYPAQFADSKVKDRRLTDLRRKVTLTVDPTKGEDQVTLRVKMKDGSTLEETVEHATGAPQNPLSDARLEEKFVTLASETIHEKPARELLQRLWHLDEIRHLEGLVD
jgi:2-methylcitrate dehydratase PrpD